MNKKILENLIEWLTRNYKNLPKSNIDGEEIVIFATGNFDDEYGYGSSDLDSFGINKDGKIVYAFASGCSCYCGAGVEDGVEVTEKLFTLKGVNEDLAEDIIKQIKQFEVENKIEIASYEYESY
jgi:hypothetical protein